MTVFLNISFIFVSTARIPSFIIFIQTSAYFHQKILLCLALCLRVPSTTVTQPNTDKEEDEPTEIMNLKRILILSQIFFMQNILLNRNFCVNAAINLKTNHELQSHSFSNEISDLILNYFQNYKHIKQLTLFFCAVPSSTFRSVQPVNSTTFDRLQAKWENEQKQIKSPKIPAVNRKYLNFLNIVEFLMTFGNFLIKADANIDAKHFDINDFYMKNMLKCGDFKEGVVLDLSCRQSEFIIQQVTIMIIKCVCIVYYVYMGVCLCF